MKNDFVITLARQYGCGGRTVGKIVAEKLGIGYYDTDLIKLAAEKNGVIQSFTKNLTKKQQVNLQACLDIQQALAVFTALPTQIWL